MADLITTSDISPNAGILGTQIADGTIQTRNISAAAIAGFQIQDGDVFKIVSEGTVSVSPQSIGTGDVTLATIPHNLGFIPAYLAFTNFNHVSTSIYAAFPQITYGAAGGALQITILYNTKIDSTNFYIYGSSAAAQTTAAFSVKYYILQETAN